MKNKEIKHKGTPFAKELEESEQSADVADDHRWGEQVSMNSSDSRFPLICVHPRHLWTVPFFLLRIVRRRRARE